MIEAAEGLRDQVEEVDNLFEIVSPLDIQKLANEAPPPMQWVINEWIPASAVGMLVAAGGFSKTWLALKLAIDIAIGNALNRKPFEIGEHGPVIYLNVEDPRDEMGRRVHEIITHENYGPVVIEMMTRNLFILPGVGIVGPMAGLDDCRNPQETEFAIMVKRACEEIKPKLLILDTKARLFGLTENDTDHNSQWMQIFEKIAIQTGCSILILHHMNKVGRGSLTPDVNAARGGSSQTDNARFVMTLSEINPETAADENINSKDYVQLTCIKSNYGKIPAPIMFKKTENGVLEFSDLLKERREKNYSKLLESFEENFNKETAPTRTQLLKSTTKDEVGKFQKAVKDFFGEDTFSKKCKNAISNFTARALAHGDLAELKIPAGNCRDKVVLIREDFSF